MHGFGYGCKGIALLDIILTKKKIYFEECKGLKAALGAVIMRWWSPGS